MRQTTKARHTLGIRGQLMWFLCFICLFLLGLFWLLSTQLLEPLYTKHIETQLTNQADSIVERLDDAIAEGKVLSSWSFGQLSVNSDFFDKLTLELYTKGTLNSFCVDISDTTLHTIYPSATCTAPIFRILPTTIRSLPLPLPCGANAAAWAVLCRRSTRPGSPARRSCW